MELLFLLLGIGGTWLFCYKKVKTRVQFDKETEQRNQSLYQENETLVEENDLLKSENAQLLMEHAEKAQDIHDQTQFLDDLIHKKESIEKEIVVLKESMNDLKTAKDELYASQEKLAQVHFEQALQKMADNINESKIKYESEYQQLMEDFAFDVQKKIIDGNEKLQHLQDEIKKTQELLTAEKNQMNAFVEVNKRAEADRTQKDFYRLNIPEDDLNEIAKIKEILPYLKNKEALNKVLWKVYYEKPYTDLVGRVIGNKQKTGIYKITNIDNNMCYVGQSVNIAERWKQHIKRGMGAETPTRNKLYPAMASFGVQNFTFEIIQECDKSELDEREDYWQEMLKVKEFGYSIK